ncbi:MAG: aspartate carbamoyltransferase, partial [Acidimicrobiia bacterium]
MKALTTLRGLSRLELSELIESALGHAHHAESHEAPGDQLSGRAVAMMFFESSTRTRLSFELAT